MGSMGKGFIAQKDQVSPIISLYHYIVLVGIVVVLVVVGVVVVDVVLVAVGVVVDVAAITYVFTLNHSSFLILTYLSVLL